MKVYIITHTKDTPSTTNLLIYIFFCKIGMSESQFKRVSKIWDRMSSTDIHLFQFKILSFIHLLLWDCEMKTNKIELNWVTAQYQKIVWPPFWNGIFFLKCYFSYVSLFMFSYFEPNFIEKFLWESRFSNFGQNRSDVK